MEPLPSGCCFRSGSTSGIKGEREAIPLPVRLIDSSFSYPGGERYRETLSRLHELIAPSLLFLKAAQHIRRIGRISPVGSTNERNKPYGHSDDGTGICGRHIDHPFLSTSSDSHLAHQIGERSIIADADRVHRRPDLLGSLRTLDRFHTDHADERRDLYLGWNEFVAEAALWMTRRVGLRK
jgi:hypothetical protein